MAADPRGLDDLVAPLEGDDGAVRSPGALASADSDTVGVPIVELPEDRAAQAFGRRLAAEALAPMSRADRPPGFGEDRGVSSSRNPGRASSGLVWAVGPRATRLAKRASMPFVQYQSETTPPRN